MEIFPGSVSLMERESPVTRSVEVADVAIMLESGFTSSAMRADVLILYEIVNLDFMQSILVFEPIPELRSHRAGVRILGP